ncbi:MAG: PEP-CTERM sorting domain-containing protein [Candidatus Omnitrophica bacterium]|nr:PEP-CTERM sorting domain-containing protein [Candidatus Omnitrophota bacterium]
MRKLLSLAVAVLVIAGFAGKASATMLTFDDPSTLGVTLGGQMTWNGDGGGHLYNEQYDSNDFIYFTSPTRVNSFQMNAMPWEGYGGGSGRFIDIAAFDSSHQQVWASTIDLTNYTAWNTWLNVSVDTENISSFTFYAPGNAPYYNGFWPSVDNMSINETSNVVPEPISLLLFGTGLSGLAFARRK